MTNMEGPPPAAHEKSKDFFAYKEPGKQYGATTNNNKNSPPPNPYLNVAQKAKLILPSALWILLIIAGVCFLCLLASLNRTLGTLDTLIELEQERELLTLSQNTRPSHSDYHHQIGRQKTHENLQHHDNHRHEHKSRADKKGSSTTQPPSFPMGDLLFSDSQQPFSSWFSLPDWTSLEPRREKNNAPEEQQLIFATFGGGAKNNNNNDNQDPIFPMLDSIMKQFMSIGAQEQPVVSSTKNNDKKHEEDNAVPKISVKIDNLSVDLGEKSSNQEKKKKMTRKEDQGGFEEIVGKMMESPYEFEQPQVIPVRHQPAVPMSPLASLLLDNQIPPSRPFGNHHHHHHATHRHNPMKLENPSDSEGQLIITALGDGGNLLPNPFSLKNRQKNRLEPYEISPEMPMLPSIIFDSEAPAFGGPTKKLTNPDEPTIVSADNQKDRQDQWNSLSKDLAGSILDTIIPQLNTGKPDDSETMVFLNGKPMDKDDGKKFMAQMFGANQELKKNPTKSTTNKPENEMPMEKIGDILNSFFSTTPSDFSLGPANHEPSSQSSGEVLVGSTTGTTKNDEPTTKTTTSESTKEPSPSPTTSTMIESSPEDLTKEAIMASLQPVEISLADMPALFTSAQSQGSSSSGGSSSGQESSTPKSVEGTISLWQNEKDFTTTKASVVESTTTPTPSTTNESKSSPVVAETETTIGSSHTIADTTTPTNIVSSTTTTTTTTTQTPETKTKSETTPKSSGQTAPTFKPKDLTERPLKTFLQKADDFIERSLANFKQIF